MPLTIYTADYLYRCEGSVELVDVASGNIYVLAINPPDSKKKELYRKSINGYGGTRMPVERRKLFPQSLL